MENKDIYKQISTQILNVNGKIGPFYFKEFFFIFFSLVIQIFTLLFLQWLFNFIIFVVLIIPTFFLLIIFILCLFARGLDPWYLFEYIDKFYQVKIAEGDSFKSIKPSCNGINKSAPFTSNDEKLITSVSTFSEEIKKSRNKINLKP